MKNSTNEKIDKILKFFIKADSTVKSVDWWEKRLNEATNQLDKMDADLSEKEPNKRKALLDELALIKNRMKIELNLVDNLENEIKTYIETKKINSKKSN